MVPNLIKAAVIALSAIAFPATAFTARGPTSHHVALAQPSDASVPPSDDHPQQISQRRMFLQNLSTAVVAGGSAAILSSLPDVANAEAETMERGGVSLTPFNSLSFNYRGAFSSN